MFMMEKPPLTMIFRGKHQATQFGSNLNEMRKTSQLCDIIIETQGTAFPAHKVILAASSAYFRQHLLNNDGHTMVVNLSKTGLVPVLDFCYTNEITIDSESVDEIYHAACLLELQEVKSVCLAFQDAENSLKSSQDEFQEDSDYPSAYSHQKVLTVGPHISTDTSKTARHSDSEVNLNMTSGHIGKSFCTSVTNQGSEANIDKIYNPTSFSRQWSLPGDGRHRDNPPSFLPLSLMNSLDYDQGQTSPFDLTSPSKSESGYQLENKQLSDGIQSISPAKSSESSHTRNDAIFRTASCTYDKADEKYAGQERDKNSENPHSMTLLKRNQQNVPQFQDMQCGKNNHYSIENTAAVASSSSMIPRGQGQSNFYQPIRDRIPAAMKTHLDDLAKGENQITDEDTCTVKVEPPDTVSGDHIGDWPKPQRKEGEASSLSIQSPTEHEISELLAASSRQGQFACPMCQRTFLTLSCIKKHLFSHFSQFQIDNFGRSKRIDATKKMPTMASGKAIQVLCIVCGQTFRDLKSLSFHRRTHTKCFSCNLCGKRFSHSGNLHRHRRTHTGEKPYVCPQCGRCYAGSSDLQIHIRNHLGEKPYKCQHCEARFINSTRLVSHMKTRHDVIPSHTTMTSTDKTRHDGGPSHATTTSTD